MQSRECCYVRMLTRVFDMIEAMRAVWEVDVFAKHYQVCLAVNDIYTPEKRVHEFEQILIYLLFILQNVLYAVLTDMLYPTTQVNLWRKRPSPLKGRSYA